MKTLIAATSPIGSAHDLFGTAIRLIARGERAIALEAFHTLDEHGRIGISTYATTPGQGLLADVAMISGCGNTLPVDERIPPGEHLYATVTFRSDWQIAGGRAVDLHAWLVARLTDFLELAGVGWAWTATETDDLGQWRRGLEPWAPLGDPFVWQDGLEASRGAL